MKSLFAPLWLAAVTAVSAAAEPPLAIPDLGPAVRRQSGRLSFELLPKSFQKNPQLEMTVVTEFSDYGKTLPEASPEKPAYYLGVNTGFLERGESVAGLHPPDPNYLGRLLQRALQANGFLAADKTHPPTLALFFHWGAHSAMDYDLSALFPDKAYREMLERAVLVGGHSFQKSLIRRLSYGELQIDPTAKLDFLRSQAGSDLYFVVVSAYDYEALRRKERKLVWRTNLTVAATGVAMADSLPALVLTGGPYFGRPVPEAEILLRTVKRGVVHLGPSQVIETDAALPHGK